MDQVERGYEMCERLIQNPNKTLLTFRFFVSGCHFKVSFYGWNLHNPIYALQHLSQLQYRILNDLKSHYSSYYVSKHRPDLVEQINRVSFLVFSKCQYFLYFQVIPFIHQFQVHWLFKHKNYLPPQNNQVQFSMQPLNLFEAQFIFVLLIISHLFSVITVIIEIEISKYPSNKYKLSK